MSTQEIQDYKLNWLRKRCFRVKVKSTSGEHYNWLSENMDEKVWEMSVNPETDEYTFFFEDALDAGTFREHFQGDSRTVDVG